MLGELIRKDIRLCRLPILAGIVLLLAPFAMAALAVSNMPLWTEATAASAWAVLLTTGSYFSVMSSQATLAMVSGNIIAIERADRSAEFLAYLPPSRKQILGSKFIVLAGIALVIWGLNLSVGVLTNWLAGDADVASTITLKLVAKDRLAVIGIAATGAGWCASAMSSNTGSAVAFAFAAPLIIQAILSAIHYLAGWPGTLDYSRVYFTSCAIVGVILFAAGTTYYLRRVHP